METQYCILDDQKAESSKGSERGDESAALVGDHEYQTRDYNFVSMWSRAAAQQHTIMICLLVGIISLACGVVVAHFLSGRIPSSSNAKGNIVISPPISEVHTCGNSPEEARARDCKFDIMSFSWLRPACYDDELCDEFSRLRPWKWYSEKKSNESSVEIPEEVIRRGRARVRLRIGGVSFLPLHVHVEKAASGRDGAEGGRWVHLEL